MEILHAYYNPCYGGYCNSNTTIWIRFSWTPSTVNRTQGPHWFLLQLLRINNPIYYWILQRVNLTFKSCTLLILEMEFSIAHNLQEWKSQ